VVQILLRGKTLLCIRDCSKNSLIKEIAVLLGNVFSSVYFCIYNVLNPMLERAWKGCLHNDQGAVM
jgi:hypothetical protein